MTEEEFEQQLEQLRQARHAAPPGLATRIIAQAAADQQDPLSWLAGCLRRSPLRSAMAALCPLIAGYVFGIAVEINSSTFDSVDDNALAIFDVYEDYAPRENADYEI